MLTRQVRTQLIVFAVLAVLAVTFASLSYVQLPQVLGQGQYDLKADFADTSGLYPTAIVTYRGVDVGTVKSLELGADGVTVRMRINAGTKIPSSAQAQIHSTSAIGEQYVDLVPSTTGQPFFRSGDVIPRARTAEMPQIAPVLDSLNALVKTVPHATLTGVLHQLNQAVGDTGPDLERLITDTSLLVKDAQANLAPTTNLLNELGPALSTQEQLAGTTSTYVHNLATFTDQLRTSDGQIRKLIDSGSAGLQAVSSLADDLTPTLPLLLANLTSSSQVLYTYLPQLKATLVAYPALIARLQTTTNVELANNEVKLDLIGSFNNPPPCTSGYPEARRRESSVVSQTTTPATLHCTLPHDSSIAVRGARNDPCPAGSKVARGATPAECGLTFSGATTTVSSSTVPYEPTTGRFVAPNGQFYTFGTPATGAVSWQSLVAGPVSS